MSHWFEAVVPLVLHSITVKIAQMFAHQEGKTNEVKLR